MAANRMEPPTTNNTHVMMHKNPILWFLKFKYFYSMPSKKHPNQNRPYILVWIFKIKVDTSCVSVSKLKYFET
jgi:hypothetical protein